MITSQLQTLAARGEPVAYAAMRIVAGAMLAFHGVQKIVGWPAGGFLPAVGSQLWLGGWIELLGGSFVAFGLFSRVAAFLASGTMAVAYFQFHWKLAISDALWIPTLNKGELAALYSFVFLFIATRGGGLASLDAAILRRRQPRAAVVSTGVRENVRSPAAR